MRDKNKNNDERFCIWSDLCGETDCNECWGYFSGEDTALTEYENDLKDRAEYYQEIIDEQNS